LGQDRRSARNWICRRRREGGFLLVRSGVGWSSRSREEHKRDRVCGRDRQKNRQTNKYREEK